MKKDISSPNTLDYNFQEDDSINNSMIKDFVKGLTIEINQRNIQDVTSLIIKHYYGDFEESVQESEISKKIVEKGIAKIAAEKGINPNLTAKLLKNLRNAKNPDTQNASAKKIAEMLLGINMQSDDKLKNNIESKEDLKDFYLTYEFFHIAEKFRQKNDESLMHGNKKLKGYDISLIKLNTDPLFLIYDPKTNSTLGVHLSRRESSHSVDFFQLKGKIDPKNLTMDSLYGKAWNTDIKTSNKSLGGAWLWGRPMESSKKSFLDENGNVKNVTFKGETSAVFGIQSDIDENTVRNYMKLVTHIME